MAKSKAQQAAIAVSMKKAGKAPKGYHKMPDGKIMKDSAHKKPKMQKGGTSWKYQDAAIRDMDQRAAKNMVDYYQSQVNHERRVQKAYPDENEFNKIKNYYNKKKVEANKEKVKINASKYKKAGGTIKMAKGGSTPAWTRSEGKNKTGGLNAKGVASYRAANPGSKLQTAVTTKPSKLKAGSKDAKRRKSFCARMSGMPGPMKDEKGRPTRKALSLRKWNC